MLRLRNIGYVMGRSRRIGLTRIALFVVLEVGALILIAVLLGSLISRWNLVNLLDQSGISVQATVITHRTESGDESDSYYLTYQFTARELQYQHEQSVSEYTFNRFPLNATVTVKYLASDPTVSMLAGDATDNDTLSNWAIFVSVSVIGVFLAAAYLGIEILRNAKMSRSGQLLRVQVVT